jgi:hypothetical protein
LRLTIPLFLIAALLAGMLVAGCGGDDSNDSASADDAAATGDSGNGGGDGSSPAEEPIATASLSKAQHVKRANAVCAKYREARIEELDAYREENPETLEEGFVGSLQDVYVPSMEEQMAVLRDLGAPRGDEDQVEAIVVAFERWLGEVAEFEGETPPAELQQGIIRAGNLASKYGLEECTFG